MDLFEFTGKLLFEETPKLLFDKIPQTLFEDIPEDWICPVCGVGKDSFEEMN